MFDFDHGLPKVGVETSNSRHQANMESILSKVEALCHEIRLAWRGWGEEYRVLREDTKTRQREVGREERERERERERESEREREREREGEREREKKRKGRKTEKEGWVM